MANNFKALVLNEHDDKIIHEIKQLSEARLLL